MDPHLAVLEDIAEERLRIGLPSSLPVRVGIRQGLAFAALSRHPDAIYAEGKCSGVTLLDALIALRDVLRGMEP